MTKKNPHTIQVDHKGNIARLKAESALQNPPVEQLLKGNPHGEWLLRNHEARLAEEAHRQHIEALGTDAWGSNADPYPPQTIAQRIASAGPRSPLVAKALHAHENPETARDLSFHGSRYPETETTYGWSHYLPATKDPETFSFRLSRAHYCLKDILKNSYLSTTGISPLPAMEASTYESPEEALQEPRIQLRGHRGCVNNADAKRVASVLSKLYQRDITVETEVGYRNKHYLNHISLQDLAGLSGAELLAGNILAQTLIGVAPVKQR